MFKEYLNSGSTKRPKDDTFGKNRNILEIVSLSTKLLIDITLREEDTDGLSNELMVNFIAVMNYLLHHHLKGSVLKSKTKGSSMYFGLYRSPKSQISAFISLATMNQGLVECFRTILDNQLYEDGCFLFSDEMNILQQFIQPISSLNFSIDIHSLNLDDAIFSEINFGLIFSAQTRLFSFFPNFDK
ncbi:RUN domain-containing protein 3A [Thelohanellus kitauei]|uniref:RUN domain-containing protein 3A n=1 Tax=Thelohanellus kitauei TaxID=669202 RepID=A0A0C2MJZ3_THEKT|nr:RUN domain-containing protein 3A [Thelohanellus kitauei]